MSSIAILVPALAGIVACGAPTKSAGDVAGLFSTSTASLQEKVDNLCEELRTRSEPPTVQGLNIKLDSCDAAGTAALDYRKIGTAEDYPDGFYFTEGSKKADTEKEILHKSMRGQVWLNKSLLGLAQAVASKMKANEGLGDGELAIPDSAEGGGVSGLATPKITILEKPTFSVDDLKFDMKINLNITGIIEADHDIQISGQMINNSFAVTVATTKDQPYEKSLIRSFNVVMFIIPHAQDVYLDLFADLYIHKPGLDAAVEDNVNKFLGTGLKSAIDSLMTL